MLRSSKESEKIKSNCFWIVENISQCKLSLPLFFFFFLLKYELFFILSRPEISERIIEK